MKIFLFLFFLISVGNVLAIDPVGQLVFDNGTVITLNNTNAPVPTQTVPQGGQVIDLSKPVEVIPTNDVVVQSVKVKHSFWWYLWPPHWWGK